MQWSIPIVERASIQRVSEFTRVPQVTKPPMSRTRLSSRSRPATGRRLLPSSIVSIALLLVLSSFVALEVNERTQATAPASAPALHPTFGDCPYAGHGSCPEDDVAAAPTNLTIDFLGPNGVMINWTDDASAMPFVVNDTVWQGLWEGTGCGDWNVSYGSAGDILLNYTISGLSPNVTYCMSVQSYNSMTDGDGNILGSNLSAAINFTAPGNVTYEVTVDCSTGLATPEGCSSSDNSAGNSTFSTNESGGNGTNPGLLNGWVEDAKYENCTIWGCQPTFAFSGNLVVPSAPSVQAGQTVFLFIGMEDLFENDIIQPVLQWGPSCAGGGNYWSIASWYVWGKTCSTASWSPLEYVAAGNLLHLTMLQEGTWQWFIEAQDESSGAYSWLLTGDFSPAMFYAYVTLEVANFGSCSEMPASGESSFFDLSMTPAKDAVWASEYPNNECSADHDDLDGSTVVLHY
jgi:hypothetical protein